VNPWLWQDLWKKLNCPITFWANHVNMGGDYRFTGCINLSRWRSYLCPKQGERGSGGQQFIMIMETRAQEAVGSVRTAAPLLDLRWTLLLKRSRGVDSVVLAMVETICLTEGRIIWQKTIKSVKAVSENNSWNFSYPWFPKAIVMLWEYNTMPVLEAISQGRWKP